MCTKAEAVVLDFEEADGVALFGERFVEDKDACFDAGVGLEDTGGKRDDGDEVFVDEHFAELFVSGLALEDDAFRNDDGGATAGGQMLGDVVDEEDFAALGLHGEAFVWLDSAFRRHEGRIGEDDVDELVPFVVGGEGVVFVDVGIAEAVEVEIDQ